MEINADKISVEYKDGVLTFNDTAKFDSLEKSLNLLNIMEKGLIVLDLQIGHCHSGIEELNNKIKVLELDKQDKKTRAEKIREALTNAGINVDEELDKLALSRDPTKKVAEQLQEEQKQTEQKHEKPRK